MTRQRTYTVEEELENTRALMMALDRGSSIFKITPEHDCTHLGVHRYYTFIDGLDRAAPPELFDWSIANGGILSTFERGSISPLCTLADADKLHPHLQLLLVQIRLGAI